MNGRGQQARLHSAPPRPARSFHGIAIPQFFVCASATDKSDPTHSGMRTNGMLKILSSPLTEILAPPLWSKL